MNRKALNFAERAAIHAMTTVIEQSNCGGIHGWPDARKVADIAWDYATALAAKRPSEDQAEPAASPAAIPGFPRARFYKGRIFEPSQMIGAERGSDAWLAWGSQGRDATPDDLAMVKRQQRLETELRETLHDLNAWDGTDDAMAIIKANIASVLEA